MKLQLQEEKATLKQEIHKHKAREKEVCNAVKTARKCKTELKKVQAIEEEVRTVNRHFRQLAIIMDQLIQQYINFDHEEVDKHEENFIEDFDKHIKVHV